MVTYNPYIYNPYNHDYYPSPFGAGREEIKSKTSALSLELQAVTWRRRLPSLSLTLSPSASSEGWLQRPNAITGQRCQEKHERNLPLKPKGTFWKTNALSEKRSQRNPRRRFQVNPSPGTQLQGNERPSGTQTMACPRPGSAPTSYIHQLINSLTSHLGGRNYGAHLPDEQTEAQRGKGTFLGPHSFPRAVLACDSKSTCLPRPGVHRAARERPP